MIDLRSVRQSYEAERQTYEAVAKSVVKRLRRESSSRSIVSRVDGRAKEMHSLLLKALSKNKTYDQIGDKAGARIVLSYPDDRGLAASMIRDAFIVKREEDFSSPRDPTRFDYSGLHFDVEIDHDGVNRMCEIQLHSPGESMWASLAHDLVYKDKSAPYDVQRALHRLRAVTELFDLEAARMRGMLMVRDMAEERQILQSLIKHYLPLAAEGEGVGRVELSLRLISALKHKLTAAERANFLPVLAPFAAREDERLKHIYETRLRPGESPFLFQPESLLIFFLLDRDPTSVAEAWPEWLPSAVPLEFAALWGVPGYDPNSLD